MSALLCPSGLGRQLSRSGSVSGSERSPPDFPERLPPLSSGDQPQQPGSNLLPATHLSDQLVPDASFKDAAPRPSHTDFEVLRQAISHLRAERQAQLQQQKQQLLDLKPSKSSPPKPVCVGTSHTTAPPLCQGSPTEPVQLTTGRKAVAATLELIHSSLQLEPGEKEKRESRAEVPAEKRRKVGGGTEPGEQRDGGPEKKELLGKSCVTSNNDTSTLSSSQISAPATGSKQPDSTSEPSDQKGKASFSSAAKHEGASSDPVGGDRLVHRCASIPCVFALVYHMTESVTCKLLGRSHVSTLCLIYAEVRMKD